MNLAPLNKWLTDAGNEKPPLTFSLDVFQIGRDYHQANFFHDQELLDLPETDHVSSSRLSLDGILIVLLILEPDNILQERLTNLVQFFREFVVTVTKNVELRFVDIL